MESEQALTPILNIARICLIGQRMNVARYRKGESSSKTSLGKGLTKSIAIQLRNDEYAEKFLSPRYKILQKNGMSFMFTKPIFR